MRKYLVIALVILVLVTPVASVDFEEVSFLDDGVEVYTQISADVPWESPFTEEATIQISVWPTANDTTWTRVSTIVVTVQRAEQDGTGYTMISSDIYDFASQPEGGEYVNTSATVSLTSSGTGSQCFFTISVVGQYGNSTDSFSYTASSPQNLVGPFSVSYSATSPLFIFGLALIVLFTLLIILGMWGVRISRSRPRRKPLLQE